MKQNNLLTSGCNIPDRAFLRELAGLGLCDGADQWSALKGGRTNSVWHVTGPIGSRVVKLFRPGADTPLFPNDHAAEAAVLGALAGKGLSPELIYHGLTVAGPVVIYAHVAGQSWRGGAEKVAQMLHKLHSTAILSRLADLRRAPCNSEALMMQTRRILEDIPESLAAGVIAAEPNDPGETMGTTVLLHGDPVPDNIICNSTLAYGIDHQAPGDNAALLIDWQCPCLGDPVLDLSIFLSPAMQVMALGRPLGVTQREAFLRCYADSDVVARLARLQAVLHWRMAAYCLWRMTRTRPDSTYAAGYRAEMAALRLIAR